MNSAAGRINGAYGEANWTPVRYVNRAYSRTALAGLYRGGARGPGDADARRHESGGQGICRGPGPGKSGVLILSRFAGAADEFRSAALLVNPYDPRGGGRGDRAGAWRCRWTSAAAPYRALRSAVAQRYFAIGKDKFLKALEPPDKQGGVRDFVPRARESERRPIARQ